MGFYLVCLNVCARLSLKIGKSEPDVLHFVFPPCLSSAFSSESQTSIYLKVVSAILGRNINDHIHLGLKKSLIQPLTVAVTYCLISISYKKVSP